MGNDINPFQPSAAFHVETSHLIYSANQITGCCKECGTGLRWVKWRNRVTTSKFKINVSKLINLK